MDRVIVTSVALRRKAFYPSTLLPDRWELACDDPLDAVLAAADRFGMKAFLGVGYFGVDTGTARAEGTAERKQWREVPKELQQRYGGHSSFYGWYLPVEAGIDGYFPEAYLSYTSEMSDFCRIADPEKPILIAPYGTRTIRTDSRFRRQLESLPVDFVAYQDEVGVRKTEPAELSRIFENLHTIHQDLPTPLWADTEIFSFEGKTYGSPLIPAPFERVREQLDRLSPWVERILCYQYPGMMNPPGSRAFAGHPQSIDLYTAYTQWLTDVSS